MPHWVQLCRSSEAPAEGEVVEAEAEGQSICLARHNGELSALDNWCPHRRGPLGQGWIEGGSVLCPWHAWAFNLHTGVVDSPEQGSVQVFPLRLEGDEVLIDLKPAEPNVVPG